MGSLLHLRTRRRIDLAARTTLGRAPGCTLLLADPRVSGEHAVIWWEDGWWVRDLGSRNGTFVGRERLTASSARVERDSRLGFGGTDDGWVVADDTPPGPHAIGPAGTVSGSFDLLLIPDAEAPLAALFLDGHQRWLVEIDGRIQPAVSGQTLELDGQAWVLSLPEVLPHTVESDAPRLPDLGLRFEVSRDEEHVQVSVQGPVQHDLGSRAHHFALLALARAWLQDEEAPPAERGWVYQDDLARGLGIEPSLLHIHIHRARRQLAELGIHGVAGLVERRQASGQIRIGIQQLQVVS